MGTTASPGEEDDPGDSLFEYEATVGHGSEQVLELLGHGEVEMIGLMPWSSNGTFLVRVCSAGDHAPAVYKPERGERPLWDFPPGLWKREVATYELSEALGLGLVPPTVMREDAPLGPGSLQAFVPARFEDHYFTIKDDATFASDLRNLCGLDVVANSADRKSGHCLVDRDGGLWAIDNGLTFHHELKLRTVIWDFAGEPLPDQLAEALGLLLRTGLPPRLAGFLEQREREAVLTRAGALLAAGRFPHDPSGRRYPWPLV